MYKNIAYCRIPFPINVGPYPCLHLLFYPSPFQTHQTEASVGAHIMIECMGERSGKGI